MSNIHSTALVGAGAKLGADVEIGPFAIVEDGAELGDGCRLLARAQVCKGAILGPGCKIHMNAVIGHVPQDFSYKGGPVKTVLGANVTCRENVTVNGSPNETGTLIGDNSYLMATCHIAHDCRLGRHVLIANGSLLAGHVHVDDHAIVSGNVVVHQFTRIGWLAILSGGSRFSMDIPPFMVGDGTNEVTALNKVGMQRASYLTDEDRRQIKSAFKLLYRSGLDIKDAVAELASFSSPYVGRIREFYEVQTKRGICPYRPGGRKNKLLRSREHAREAGDGDDQEVAENREE